MQDLNKKTKKQVGNEDSKKKERHIVTWTQEVPFAFFLCSLFHVIGFKSIASVVLIFERLLELQEDDILREQISLHGTDKYGLLFFFIYLSFFLFLKNKIKNIDHQSDLICWSQSLYIQLGDYCI